MKFCLVALLVLGFVGLVNGVPMCVVKNNTFKQMFVPAEDVGLVMRSYDWVEFGVCRAVPADSVCGPAKSLNAVTLKCVRGNKGDNGGDDGGYGGAYGGDYSDTSGSGEEPNLQKGVKGVKGR